MQALPVIVGFGGYNAAGRSSSHQAFRRLVLESLSQEEQEQTNRNHALNQLIDQREKESYEYYELTGELDDYAIAKIERYEYEEYAKQFDNNEDDEVNDYINEDNFSDYDSDRSS